MSALPEDLEHECEAYYPTHKMLWGKEREAETDSAVRNEAIDRMMMDYQDEIDYWKNKTFFFAGIGAIAIIGNIALAYYLIRVLEIWT